MTSTWLRNWLAKVALATLVPLSFLVLAEIILRHASIGIDPSWTVPDDAVAGAWRDNPDIGRLWFPPGQVRSPVPFRAAVDTNRIRVVVLGESAAMGDPVPEFGLGPHLEQLLRTRFPDQGIDVINAAMTAIDSSIIVDIARDIGKLRPDFVVVYMGNNEVVGPFGPAPDHQSMVSLDARYARLVLAVRSTRIGQSLMNLWYAGQPDGTSWRGLAQFTDRVVAPESEVLDAIRRRYRDNLAMIVRRIRNAGAEPVLATVASRPFWAPFGTDNTPGGLDANAMHQKSLALLDAGARVSAQDASLVSRDLDPLRFRADGAINDMIRLMADRAAVVDVESVIKASPDDPPDLFWDHVHFTPRGNYLAARAVAESMEPLLSSRGLSARADWPDQAAVSQALIYTVWDELNATSVMYQRLSRPPFTSMSDHRSLVAQITSRFRALRNVVTQRDVEKARDALADVTVPSPMLPGPGARLIRAYEELEQFDEAMAVATRLSGEWPHVRSCRHTMGRQLIRAGNVSDGLRLLEQGEVPGTSRPRQLARIEAAAGLAEIGRVSEALGLLDRVVAEEPGYAKAWYNRAVIFSRLGQLDRAQADFLKALSAEPDMAEAYNNLGVIALKLGRMDDAERHFRQALGQHPYHVGALRNLSMILTAKGDKTGAEELTEALEVCDPDWDASVAGG